MKRRTLTLTLCILVCVALIGVGFASWVITHEDTETQTGNITVDTVEDKSHTITVLTSDSEHDLAVHFGVPATLPSLQDGKTAWLTNDATEKEDLVATFKIEVTNYESANVAVAADNGFVVKNGDTVVDASTYNTLFTHKVEISGFTAKEGETTTGVATVTITFDYGSDFGTKNPYEYYNNQDFTSEIANTAETKLKELYAFNNYTFVLTLVTSSKTSSN